MQYGVCYNFSDQSSYCAVKKSSCADSELFIAPDPDLVADCSCDNVNVGGCIEDTSGLFSHCAVDNDSCADGQRFMNARELQDSSMGIECRLCKEPSIPTLSPTVTSSGKPSASPIMVPGIKFPKFGGCIDRNKSKSSQWCRILINLHFIE